MVVVVAAAMVVVMVTVVVVVVVAMVVVMVVLQTQGFYHLSGGAVCAEMFVNIEINKQTFFVMGDLCAHVGWM